MHTSPHVEVTNAYFGALGSGDVPTAMALLDPGVVWHQPGTNRFSGDHSGVAGVGGLLHVPVAERMEKARALFAEGE